MSQRQWLPNRRLWIMSPGHFGSWAQSVLTRCIDCQCCFGCTFASDRPATSLRLLIAWPPVNSPLATFSSDVLCARNKTVSFCSLGSLENLIGKFYINQQSVLLVQQQYWSHLNWVFAQRDNFLYHSLVVEVVVGNLRKLNCLLCVHTLQFASQCVLSV